MYKKKQNPRLRIFVRDLVQIEGHVKRMLRNISFFLKAQESEVFKPTEITVRAVCSDEDIAETWKWRWKSLGIVPALNDEGYMAFTLDVAGAQKLKDHGLLPAPRPEGNPHLFPGKGGMTATTTPPK